MYHLAANVTTPFLIKIHILFEQVNHWELQNWFMPLKKQCKTIGLSKQCFCMAHQIRVKGGDN